MLGAERRTEDPWASGPGASWRARLPVAWRAGLAVAACLASVLVTAGSALADGSPATYSATETIPVPPASSFQGSAGGDGWAVALSATQVFNVFHHQGTLQVACHDQSDASDCWSAESETITDSSGDNFATSGQPGLYLDQNTGKLYVYATRTSDGTGGVVCIDTTQAASSSDPFCGFTALTAAGDAPVNSSGISSISDPMLSGGRWFAFNYVDSAGTSGAQNHLLCFDVETDAPCSGQPYPVDIGSGTTSVNSFPEPATALIGSRIILPITVGGVDELACYDVSTGTNCAGAWPVALGFSFASDYGAPFPLLDGSGAVTGLCLPTGTDQCYTLAGASTATPAGMGSVIGPSGGTTSWNGPAFVLGPRVYVPDGNLDEVECYDYATDAACTDFPKSFNGSLSLLYTVNADPQRPSCVWVNSDSGQYQIQNFDAYTGGACGQGSIRVLASQFVVNSAACTPASYTKIQVLTPGPSAYSPTSSTIEFDDGDGSPITTITPNPQNLDSTGAVSLAGMGLNTATGLPQFLFTLNGLTGQPPSVQVQLTWTGSYDTSCIKPGTSVTTSPSNAPTPSSSCPAGQTPDVANDPLEATGCFSPGPRGSWVSTGGVRVNGIDFDPRSGNIVLDLPARTLHASGSGVILLGGVVPAGGWVGSMTVDFSHKISLVPDSGTKIKGFPLEGTLEAELADGGEAKIAGTVSLRLLGDDVSASLAVITSNQDGLAGVSLAVMPADADPSAFELSSCSPKKQPPLGFECANVISPKGNAYSGLVAKQPGVVRLFGFLPVEGLSLSWDRSSDQWSFQAALAPRDIFHLGDSGNLPTLTIGGSFGWNPFRFNGASLADSSVAIPLFDIAVLDSFGFHVNLHPFGFGGNVALRAGPGLQAVQIGGGVDYETKSHESGFDLKVSGSWSLKGEVGVNGHVEYDSLDGAHTVIVGGGFTRSWAGIVTATVELQGGIAIPHWQLNADGDISLLGLSDIGAKGVVSDKGLGLCGEAHLLFFSGEIGFTHLWSGKTDFNGCDFSGVTTVSGGGAGDTASVGRVVRLTAHLPREEFALVGADAPPNVTLVGPHGQRLSTPTSVDRIETSPTGLAVAVSSSNTTYFIVEHPAAGPWRIIPSPGSSPTIRYEVAAPLKPLGLRARVLGSGQRRTLRFRFNPQPGETVAFVQQGGTEQTILSTARGVGARRFSVSPGPGGPRTIVAVVSFDGLPREELVVARFTAPAPARPRPTGVRYLIRRGRAIISWRRLGGIGSYEVQITLAHALVRYQVPGRASGIIVRLPDAGRIRRIIVRATSASGIAGPNVVAIRRAPVGRPHRRR